MLLRIESSSAVPLYRQIVDQVRYQIASGALRPGDRLPSVRELARQLPANQNTVLKAYEILAQAGLISRRQGDGTFVEEVRTTIKKAERVKQLSGILAQAAAQAVHFQITPEELHELLDREIEAMTREEPAHARI
jgi:GntR family transcriptional regulator